MPWHTLQSPHPRPDLPIIPVYGLPIIPVYGLPIIPVYGLPIIPSEQ